MKVYASVFIGAYEISMKVFEITKGKRIHQIDSIRARIELLSDVYRTGRISHGTLERIIEILKDFEKTIKTYRCDRSDICAGPSFAQSKNLLFALDKIRLRTKREIILLDNPKERFLVYKALAAGRDFEEIIRQQTVMADIGGNTLQLTLFSEGKLLHTQHINLGATEVLSKLRKLESKSDFREQTSEMLYKEISVYYNMFLKQTVPDALIIINSQLLSVPRFNDKNTGVFSAEEYRRFIKKSVKNFLYTVDADELRLSYLLLYQSVLERLPVEKVYVPPVSIHEGLAYDYAYEAKQLTPPRDFDRDILSAAWAISRRYNSYQPHLKALEKAGMLIFDTTKKIHGMNDRMRLLLRVAAILHDCGKYISVSDAAECSHAVIMSSEILGLSDSERAMIAQMTIFHRKPVEPYEDLADRFTKEEYRDIIKLVAILRVANAMDRSHKQKIKKSRMSINAKGELLISIDAEASLTLERGLFEEKAQLFTEVYGIRPVLRERKI